MSGTESAGRRAVAYFQRPGYRRMLRAIWRKYEALGRIGGRAVVENVTEEESEAIGSFFGWNVRPGDTVTIPLALFEEELRASAFAIGLVELYRLLESEPLLTRSERRLLQDGEWRRFLLDIRNSAGDRRSPAVDEWLSDLETGGTASCRVLRDLFHTDRDLALLTAGIVVRTLEFLFGGGRQGASPEIRLPVLAARVSGDAHALDVHQPAGRMLLSILREKIHGENHGDSAFGEKEATDDTGSGTLATRETYRRFGILDDDVSSIIHWLVPQPGQPVLPKVWSLRQVEAAERFPSCSRIYAVENPAVFSTIADLIPLSFRMDEAPLALLCTSGPASAAAIRWIQRCLEVSGEECRLFYSGDFDLKGLTMGMTLAKLFPDRFTPWRFGGDTYLSAARSLPGPKLDDNEISRLEKWRVSWDSDLCAQMVEVGRKVHQESFVELLAEDVLRSLHGLW